MTEAVETKICIDCKQPKLIEKDFHKSWKSRDGRQHRCKTCNLTNNTRVKRMEPALAPSYVFDRVPPSEADFVAARDAGLPLALWGILHA